MASGFFAILDDIAALMDDVAVMSKVAAKKTAGILGDDLAVNAEKASGFVSSREIPVLWSITKGSMLNKVIILPVAFLLSAFLPIAITIALLLGGLYLAYEGAEKIYHFVVPHPTSKKESLKQAKTQAEVMALEKERIKSAIVTDFILSVEIIIIALGTVSKEGLSTQIPVVTIIALLATVGVYGIVALIVRMDDAGYKLIKNSSNQNSFKAKFGGILVAALPKVIKSLTVIGTIALLLVSGGIFAHNVEFLHGLFPAIPSILTEFILGLVVGIVVLVVVKMLLQLKKSLFPKSTIS
jgi:predicted DNA repair protein MutK